MKWDWLMPWKRHAKPDTTRQAEQYIAQVRRQQPEVDQLTRDISARHKENHFSTLWEQGLRGGPK